MYWDSWQVAGENILIVDDNLEHLQILSTTLSEKGYRVQSVVSGSMALTVAQLSPPDLILLDIKMPDMDGFQVCERLKECKTTCDIPIIFLSVLHRVSEKIKAFKMGGVDYITKPFQLEELFARIKHQLIIKRLYRQLKEQNQQLEGEIAQRLKAEVKAVAASQAKSQFLANMSHELRTPLNAIMGFSQLMSDDSLLNAEQQENIRIINRSAENLLELINDILELSKIESGVMSLDKTSFDLYRLLDNIEEMFQIKAEEKNIQLNFIVASKVPQYIYTDQKKLRSCLTNLISNAITAIAVEEYKFTPQGSVTLRVSFIDDRRQGDKETRGQEDKETRGQGDKGIRGQEDKETRGQGDKGNVNFSAHLLFEVEDTGCGISPDELDRLFDAFVQAEAGKKSSQGTGLGLAITLKFVEMMGGEIKVESTLGKGSIFAFDIEVDIPVSTLVDTLFEQKVIGLKPNQSRFKILVVDDSEESRLLLVKLLQNIGFDVLEAENGQVAMLIWKTWKPHLILMDTRMPVMDGMTATQRLRNLNQNHDDLSIIAITASDFTKAKNELKKAGFDDVISKPVSPEIVLQKIAEYLNVSYFYEQVSASDSSYGATRYLNSTISHTSLFEELMTMPRNWLSALHQAAKEVNEDLLQSVIEEIPEHKIYLSQILTRLVKNFRLDIILQFTQKIIGN